MDGVVHFVLDGCEKLPRNVGAGDIVNTRSVNVGHLLPKVPFGRTDVADSLEQFTEITPAAVFEPLVVKRKTLADIFV
jgi:hypothetical protein